MLRSSTRAVVIAGLLAASTLGVGAVGLTAGVAGATSAAATCKTLTATGKAETSSTGTLKTCTPSSVTGGGAKVSTTQSLKTFTGTATITWNGGKGTTTSKFTFKLNPKSSIKCATGDILVQESSTTTGGTNKKIPTGQKSTLYLCSNSKSEATSLAPGQTYSI